MSAATDFDTSEEWQKLTMKWMAAGHEVIHARGTFRHKAYRQEFEPDQIIFRERGVPFITHSGKTLRVGDVYPERADVCLNMDAIMLPQHEFEKRYIEVLNWYNFVEGSDPKSEPIPNINRYISHIKDPFSESPGPVEIGFDAHKPAEADPTHHYDSDKDKMVEIVKQQGEAANLTMEAVKQLLEERLERDTAPDPSNEPAKRGPGRPRKDQ